MKRELNGSGVWLREGEQIDREGNVTGTPVIQGLRHSDGRPRCSLSDRAQLVYKLLTAEQEYENHRQ